MYKKFLKIFFEVKKFYTQNQLKAIRIYYNYFYVIISVKLFIKKFPGKIFFFNHIFTHKNLKILFS